jgi:adenylosuccinate lyase
MDNFISPIHHRYQAPLLSPLWSPIHKIITMRNLWISLAKHQYDLGVSSITLEGIQQMEENKHHIDFAKIEEYENQFKHDIMAHIHAFGDICPLAKSFIHLGVTSNFINDNTDSILILQSLHTLLSLSKSLFHVLKEKSIEYGEIPTIAYTHLQRGQLTTVGKRFAMWNADVYQDILAMERCLKNVPFRGIKGTVGSEDTILKLMKGDHTKCKELNERLAKEYGFEKALIITGQTYSRKYDVEIVHTLSGIAQSIYKMMNDIRLLSGKMEIYESFGEKQIGSSAMPYKKNPITCEKICSLARYIINQEMNIQQTYINQWLERSLDDSALKRIMYPEVFLLTEHILTQSISILKNIVVEKNNIEKSVQEHMKQIVSEEIILQGVEMGYNRQELHEELRNCYIYQNGDFEKNEKIQNILQKGNISISPNYYIGRCKEQIDEFYNECLI